MIDLSPFCSKDPCRPYLLAPFSHGEFTYATNGHILVRVPRRADIEVNERDSKSLQIIVPGIDKILNECAGITPETFAFAMPEPTPEGPCKFCHGHGNAHASECENCDCGCTHCDDSGVRIDRRRLRFPAVDIREDYVRLILALPGALFTPSRPDNDDSAPLPFTFDGGRGAVMAMNRKSVTSNETVIEMRPLTGETAS